MSYSKGNNKPAQVSNMDFLTRAFQRLAIQDRRPPQAFNFDCASLIFDHLAIEDIFRLERVSKTWRDYVRDWMSGPGMHKLFPDAIRANSEAGAGIGSGKRAGGADPADRFKRFLREGTCSERWETGRANVANEYVCSNVPHLHSSSPGIYTAGDYLVYTSGWHIFGTRLGQEKGAGGTPSSYPVRELDAANANLRRAGDVRDIRVHASGLAVVYNNSVHNHCWQTFDIKTGNMLWTTAIPQYINARDYNVALGWHRLYRFDKDLSVLDSYDIRTGALVSSQQTGLILEPTWGTRQGVIWRLQGRDVLVTIDARQVDPSDTLSKKKMLCIMDTETHQIIQRIPLEHANAPRPYQQRCGPLVHVSSRHDDHAFAVITAGCEQDGAGMQQVRTIRTFQYHAREGKFKERTIEHVDLRGFRFSNRTAFDIDPFRRFLIAQDSSTGRLCRYPTPYVFAASPHTLPPVPASPLPLFVGDDTTTPYPVVMNPPKPGATGATFASPWKAKVMRNRLYLYYWKKHSDDGVTLRANTRTVALTFGSSAPSIPDPEAATCLHHPDGLAEKEM
ncbi:F-box protein [Aspergillus mulundensis]|uniref:F-box domain-containing protein n=1 Tax=Aspergillus mulundensis TaxID=1810919 RepID=A0A3D8T2N0_9EURO|nr:hypothetical protein DSM5745_00091 [Aspergillus mulundensis]RDW92769.1 hypothetical protein DSM5745_00091 [Aspergillus mulundensis]